MFHAEVPRVCHNCFDRWVTFKKKAQRTLIQMFVFCFCVFLFCFKVPEWACLNDVWRFLPGVLLCFYRDLTYFLIIILPSKGLNGTHCLFFSSFHLKKIFVSFHEKQCSMFKVNLLKSRQVTDSLCFYRSILEIHFFLHRDLLKM